MRYFCFGSIKNKISVQNVYKSGKVCAFDRVVRFRLVVDLFLPVIESSTPLTLILSRSVSAVLLVAR